MEPDGMIPQTNLVDKPAQLGGTTPTVSLPGLLDLLSALGTEINELPDPTSLFAHELARTISEAVGLP